MPLRRRGKFLLVTLAIFIGVVAALHSCTFRMSQREINNYFQKRGQKVDQVVYSHKWRTMNFIRAGKSDGPLVLFVHGSPGSLTAFIDFVADTALQKSALLISCDRPGFGYSNFGAAEPSLARQAESLKPILESHPQNRPVILVGHSLGGPLIAKMAAMYPDLVDGIIIVAGSNDPELEPNETWFRAPLSTPFLSWILPRSFRASNEEIYNFKAELTDMLDDWARIKCPVVVIQGEKDNLVPKENAEFTKRVVVNAPVKIVYEPEMNHFVPWTHPQLIRKEIFNLLQRAEKEDQNH